MKKVIIYDKDGTLLDYHKIWQPYAHKCINDFVDEFNLDKDVDDIGETLGLKDGEIMPNSVIASGTGDDIHRAFESLHEGGGKWAKAYYEENLDMLVENMARSEERRVGKERSCGWWREQCETEGERREG